jgi:proton-translocating NADH-quinone oxidoreductase chain N
MNIESTMIWLLAVPFISSPLIYLSGRLYERRMGKPGLARWLAVLSMLVTGGFLFQAFRLFQLQGQTQLEITLGTVVLRMDGISLLLAFTVLMLGLMVMIFSTSYMFGEINEEKYYALLVAMIGSIIGLGCAGDLFNLWVWFEAMAVTSYTLVAFYRDEQASLEAGVKYLVQSATGSVFVLVGIALVFAQVGTLKLDEIVAAVNSTTPILLVAGAFFLIGFGIKTALVPLHTWLPDAHSQAPSGISAMLSGVVIEAGLVAMLRATGGLAGTSANWGGILLGFGAFNMLIGNLMALRQTQVKRLLAYSSVAHIGYMLLGLGVSVMFQTADGAVGAFFHLFNHAMMKGLAFLAAGALLYTLHLSKGEHSPLVVEDLDGASRRYPLVAFTFSVAVLGLGGLPPLSGFMSKWQIFMAGVSTQNIWIILLVIFAALNSVLSLVYYAPLVNRIYRHEPSAAVKSGAPMTIAMGLPLVLLSAGVIVLGIWPSLMDWLTGPAGASLMTAFGLR